MIKPNIITEEYRKWEHEKRHNIIQAQKKLGFNHSTRRWLNDLLTGKM